MPLGPWTWGIMCGEERVSGGGAKSVRSALERGHVRMRTGMSAYVRACTKRGRVLCAAFGIAALGLLHDYPPLATHFLKCVSWEPSHTYTHTHK